MYRQYENTSELEKMLENLKKNTTTHIKIRRNKIKYKPGAILALSSCAIDRLHLQGVLWIYLQSRIRLI